MTRLLGEKTAATGCVMLAVLLGWLAGVDRPFVRYLAILLAFIVTVVVKHRRRLYAVLRTLPRDVR